MALGFFWLALAGFLATTAEAQLFINVYPSQNNTNQTLWLFSGEQQAEHTSTIRSSGNYHRRDFWKMNPAGPVTNFYYGADKPTNAFFNLTPLFGSTNAIDIESIRTRFSGLPGSYGSLGTNTLWFHYHATNAPTVTTGSGSKTIGKMFMNDTSTYDEMGIRHTGGSNLWYTNQQRIYFSGAGIMDKPILDFGSAHNNSQERSFLGNTVVWVHHQVIPEPEQYALVFGIFALAFVIFRRRFQKKGLN